MPAKTLEKASSIESLRPLELDELEGRTTDFQLYLDIAGKPVLYADGPYEWSIAEIEKLHEDGFSVLFYDPKARNNADSLEYGKIEPMIDDAVVEVPSEVLSHVRDGLSSTIATLNVQSPVSAAKISAVFDDLVVFLTSYPQLTAVLRDLSHHDTYTFFHSIRTCALSVAIAEDLGVKDEDHLHDIALGAVLHDIGHLKVEREILEKQGALTSMEWVQVRQHPRQSIELLEEFEISPTTKAIIIQHHERPDGKGYPFSLTCDEICPEARIVNLADIFAALTSPRPYQRQLNKTSAVAFIRQNLSEFVAPVPLASLETLIAD
ncbi:MAG: HD domain-containing protein [Pseudobacteriovorax sp.]|nr:HD domain-containing protein [Pseudobacteriovorax sp.]